MSEDNYIPEINIGPQSNSRKRDPSWKALLLKGFDDLHRLQPKYYRLTSRLGMIAGTAFVISILLFALVVQDLLNLKPGGDLRDHPNGMLALVLLFVFLPILAYAAMILIAGTFGIIMVCLGKMTTSETLRYAFLSHYPDYWMQKRYREHDNCNTP